MSICQIYDLCAETLWLGRYGENGARDIAIDVGKWFADFGAEGTVVLVNWRPGEDDTPYNPNVTMDGSRVVWSPSSIDLAISGRGFAELRYYVGNALAKSKTFRTIIDRTPSEGANPPSAAEDWLERMEDAAVTAQTASDTAVAAAETATEGAQAVAQALPTITQAAQTATSAAATATSAATEAALSEEVASAAANAAQTASETATAASQTAVSSASTATTKATQAVGAAGTATTKASEAAQAATTATEGAQTSTFKAGEATTAAATATSKATEATTAASTASAAATTATSAASTATSAASTATAAKTAAQTAQTGAETAQTAAESAAASVTASAEQIETNTSDISEIKADLEDYQNAISEYIQPVNMFNKNSALNRDGYKVNVSGGYVALNGATVSHPIKVEVGKTYVFKFSASYYGVTANRIVRFCDAEGDLILSPLGDPYINATPFADNSGGVFTITSEMSAYEYCCVNVRTSDKDVMIFAESSTLPAYSDYFVPYWKIKESALPSEMPLPLNAEYNPLYGKKAAFTGDSICYGAGSTGGYASIIGNNNSMTVSNIAVSGGTICSGTGRFCISESVDNMPENYDYYIVEGGVNDASQEHGETLGTISSGYNATLNTATMCGAMESLCKKLQLNFKGKKYGFIFPHNVYGDTSVWNTSWRATMKQCLEKWGIPYLDLSEECAQLRNLDALRIYTSNNDGWHPTEDGYKFYYVPKIEAWMKTL